MKTNFYLETHHQHHDLRINLHGIFDGSSAFELIQTIKDKQNIFKAVFIDTTNVTSAIPFGREILNTHLPQRKFRTRLHFSGRHAKDIIPQGCVLLKGKMTKKHRCSGNCKNCACRSSKVNINSKLSQN